MFRKRSLIVISFLLVFVLMPISLFADVAGVGFLFRSAYVRGQYLDIFIERRRPYEDITVAVSNLELRIDSSGLLSVTGDEIRTTIIVNVSNSMPVETMDNLRDFMLMAIARRGRSEYIRIISVGDGVPLIAQDFSNHTIQLNDAVARIFEMGFESRPMSVADAIYNAIPTDDILAGPVAFHRAIVLTDALHDELGRISRLELYERLRVSSFPLFIAYVTTRVETLVNEALMAQASASRGISVNLNAFILYVGDVFRSFDMRYLYLLRAFTPINLLDDSLRSVTVTIDGATFSFSAWFPVFAGTPGGDGGGDTGVGAGGGITQVPIIGAVAEFIPSVFTPTGLIIIAGVLAAAVLFFVAYKYRPGQNTPEVPEAEIPKIKREPKPKIEPIPKKAPKPKPEPNWETTEVLLKPSNIDYNTINIRLRNITNGMPLGYHSISNGLTIGRSKSCGIVLTDKSVSDEHCRIYEKNRSAVIENMSQTRITKLNDELIKTPGNLIAGDKITCGSISLLVEEIVLPKQPLEDLNKLTHFANV